MVTTIIWTKPCSVCHIPHFLPTTCYTRCTLWPIVTKEAGWCLLWSSCDQSLFHSGMSSSPQRSWLVSATSIDRKMPMSFWCSPWMPYTHPVCKGASHLKTHLRAEWDIRRLLEISDQVFLLSGNPRHLEPFLDITLDIKAAQSVSEASLGGYNKGGTDMWRKCLLLWLL